MKLNSNSDYPVAIEKLDTGKLLSMMTTTPGSCPVASFFLLRYLPDGSVCWMFATACIRKKEATGQLPGVVTI